MSGARMAGPCRSSVPPHPRHAGAAGSQGWRFGRQPAVVTQYFFAEPEDANAGDDDFILAIAYAVGLPARARPLSGDGDRRRARQRQVDPLGVAAQHHRSAPSAPAQPAARRAGSGGRRAQPAHPGVRQRVGPETLAVGRPLPRRVRGRVWHPRALHRSRRSCVLGRAPDHPQWHRGSRRAAGPGRALDLFDLRADRPQGPEVGG